MAAPTDADRERQLLAEGEALRRLARSLLGNGADADDLVQSTFAASLASPRSDAAAAPWLRATMRNLALLWRRTTARRSARERLAAVAERQTQCDPARIAQELESMRDVVAAVHALEEPFRTVVVLRFWRGLLPEAIARELGVPRNTVRSRLQRGLDRLRARLDGLHGSRTAWAAPLSALIGWRAGVPVAGATVLTVLAGVIMKTKSMLAVAALLLAAISIPLLLPSTTATQASPISPSAPAPLAADASRPLPPQRQQLAEPATSAPAGDAASVQVEPWPCHFLVVDEASAPIDDATITVWASTKIAADAVARSLVPGITHTYQGHASTPLVELHTAADGRAAATFALEQLHVAATSPTRGSTGELPLFHAQAQQTEIRLVIAPPIRLCGVVHAADGAPVAGATVQARINGGSTLQRGEHRAPAPVSTDAEGRFELPVQYGCSYVLAAEAGGEHTLSQSIDVLDHQPKAVLLTFPGAITVHGFVLDAEGAAVAQARVTLWREFDADAPGQEPDDFENADTTSAVDGSFAIPVRRFARYQLVATAQQTSSDLLWVTTSVARPHAEAVLRLARLAPLCGRVLHADGSPFPGVVVRARPEQGHDVRGGIAVPAARDRFPRVADAIADADGAFALRVHPGTSWTLFACPDREDELLRYATLGVAAGSRGIRIVLDDAQLAGCHVHGTVLAADPPVEDCRFDLLLADELTGKERPHQLELHLKGDRFELPRLPLGARFSILLMPKQRGSTLLGQTPYAPCCCGPFTADRRELEVRVQVQRWAELPVRVLQADGAPARGVLVNMTMQLPLPWGHGPIAVDAEGRVRLCNRLPGERTVTVWRDQDKLSEQQLTVLPGANPELVMHLPSPKGH